MTQPSPTDRIALIDLIPLAHPDAMARVLGQPVQPAMLEAVVRSHRLLRRWIREVRQATGLPEELAHDGGPATRAVLQRPLQQLDTMARVADACLASDHLRRGIAKAEVAALKLRYGLPGYLAGLTWDQPVPDLPDGTDGWDLVDAWISTRPDDLKGYVALRCPHPLGPPCSWGGPALDALMDHAAAAAFAPQLEDAA